MTLEKICVMLQDKVLIKEIFESVQGEGPYVGINQLFIRFSNCNLKCKYCDTDFRTDLKEYSVPELYSEIKKYNKIHSVSLTGGEPLIEVKFLKQLLPLLNKKVYLETNGTLYENLKTVIDYIDIVSIQQAKRKLISPKNWANGAVPLTIAQKSVIWKPHLL